MVCIRGGTCTKEIYYIFTLLFFGSMSLFECLYACSNLIFSISESERAWMSEVNKIWFVQVPLGLGIIWAYAFLLTAAGAYNYNGCNIHIPSSNIISEKCRKHAFTMTHCRTDMSVAMKTADWFRFPYPLQWGIPVFHWKSACIMIVASIIASIDSVSHLLLRSCKVLYIGTSSLLI